MTQTNVDFSDNPTGSQLMDDYLAKEQENNLTTNSGIKRPSYAVAGTKWLDTSFEPWALKMFTGSNDVIIGYIDKTKGTFKPDNALPDLEGQAGKYLTNNGENSYWDVLDLDSRADVDLSNLSENGKKVIANIANEKHQLANNGLPSSPDETVFYYIPE